MRRFGESLAVGLLSVSLLGGCGSGGKPNPDVSPSPGSCNAIDLGNWTGVPVPLLTAQGVAPRLIADKLHTTIDAVDNGEYGLAECTPGYTPRQVAEHPVVSVSGTPGNIGNLCLVLFVASATAPQEGVPYNDLQVVCPTTQTA